MYDNENLMAGDDVVQWKTLYCCLGYGQGDGRIGNDNAYT